MAAKLTVELVKLGWGSLPTEGIHKNLIVQLGAIVKKSAVTTVDDTGATVGVAGWCWRVTVWSGNVRLNPAAAASATAGILAGTVGESVVVLPCTSGVPLSFIEATD